MEARRDDHDAGDQRADERVEIREAPEQEWPYERFLETLLETCSGSGRVVFPPKSDIRETIERLLAHTALDLSRLETQVARFEAAASCFTASSVNEAHGSRISISRSRVRVPSLPSRKGQQIALFQCRFVVALG